MPLTTDEVERVARLARLDLTEEEKQLFPQQIDAILAYLGKLRELPTNGASPTAHVLPLENVFREDLVQPSLPQEAVLANAPEKEDAFFKVPQILADNS